MLFFSRASCIGAHRYGGIWYGDNQSWWSHLAMNLKMLPSANMCGFLFSGADLGGFGSSATEDLLLRWLQLGVFTPLMRNHCAMGNRAQEAYQFSEAPAMAKILGIRYGLLPYLYSEFVKAALADDMLFRPMHFDYPDDPHAAQVEDQLMLGEGLMIAPVLEQNATGRYVYLPEPMQYRRLRSGSPAGGPPLCSRGPAGADLLHPARLCGAAGPGGHVGGGDRQRTPDTPPLCGAGDRLLCPLRRRRLHPGLPGAQPLPDADCLGLNSLLQKVPAAAMELQ